MSNQLKPEQIEKLHAQLLILNEYLRRRTSFLYMFAYAVVQGIGYAIGATIIASIIVAIIARVIITVDYVPILNQIFTSEQVQESLLQEDV